MEKHRCKLCFKSFSNGRALGGHMRSHMLNLPIPPKPVPAGQPVDDTESASSSAASSEEEVEVAEDQDKGLCYGLRENPKKSFRLADPEFSFAVDATSSVVLQDRESETESSKNPTRRRSKRTRNPGQAHHQYHHHHQDAVKPKSGKQSGPEPWAEPEPVSSISDATTEEDVAFCLMMLSRDKWSNSKHNEEVEEEEEEEEEYENVQETDDFDSDDVKLSKPVKGRGKYRCETCKKLFRSYQALGGHRASHKKLKVCSEPQKSGPSNVDDRRSHECPVCFRVFASGQALGGHKRSHLINSATTARSSVKFGDNLIDLNLPAPIDDDDVSQVELSAVSDAGFANSIKR